MVIIVFYRMLTNYLFCGDHDAAVSMSVICSLLATCKANEVNPRDYLNDIIARMPYMQKVSYDELLQLLPHKWKSNSCYYYNRTMAAYSNERVAAIAVSVLYRMLTDDSSIYL